MKAVQNQGRMAGPSTQPMESPKRPPLLVTSLGRANKEGPRVAGRTSVVADVDPNLVLKVFKQVEAVLSEFSSLMFVRNQLLQWLVCDFWTVAAKAQTELAQRVALEELLREHGGEKDGDQNIMDAMCMQFCALRSEASLLRPQHAASITKEEQWST